MNNPTENRPNPDELLEALKQEQAQSKRGKLKIFFGMCAGVGKTCAMLEAAHAELKKGADVVVGYVETHNRTQTAQMAVGLPTVARKKYYRNNILVEEMDLDAIIQRKPQIVLVDELAHTNAPEARHAKRYQDVLELLDNGINVYTTLNVQHLESRAETVAQITGIIVRETLPDSIFENADEVEVIDLTTAELLERLAEGKIYGTERARHARENFFRQGNITALREMALRIVADRVDKQLNAYMQYKRIKATWKSAFRFLIVIDATPQSTFLLRSAKTLAYSIGATAQAIYVETLTKPSPQEQQQLSANFKLAKQLEIPCRTITNDSRWQTVLDFAQKENITHVLVRTSSVGSLSQRWRQKTFINQLLRHSGNIDVYVIGAENTATPPSSKSFVPVFTSSVVDYLLVTFLVVVSAVICNAFSDYLGYEVVSYVFLFVISIFSLFFGTTAILLAAVLYALIWDYFFIPPIHTFHIGRVEDILMLVMFFVIALLNGILTSRIRRQEKKTRAREEQTHALYQITRRLASLQSIEEITQQVASNTKQYFGADVAVFIKNEADKLEKQTYFKPQLFFTDKEESIIDWVFRNNARAGRWTDTLPATRYTFYPLTGDSQNMGVLAVAHNKNFTQADEQFWEAFLSLISGKYEREYLRNLAKQTYLLAESDKLYRTLFNSISHELRIPIATIMGASDLLLSQNCSPDDKTQLENEINTASLRLNRLVENLLNMSRIESGHLRPHPDWCDVQDLANALTTNLQKQLAQFHFQMILPAAMPLVKIDFGLTENIVHNLLLNATQYTPQGAAIDLSFGYEHQNFVVKVADAGKGFTKEELRLLFDSFYRGKTAQAGGVGLGLSIVKGLTQAQGGTVAVANRPEGGAVFTVTIPCEALNPQDVHW
ncbi:two-component system, OmpR family, sensor histidine kinase KdpD [Flexibacter flexilis DSM 6793]|uniref:histidine kinase n=1 Tax=Flexibacter flexilis DSM 6793 TaxID=927664 RepID=A0A1I1DUQ7_9BACT|nr:sensor histidine kinase KdpD [Flexibacter flexilis]SFB78601.1 two-component system, OmpR family, sensor histidine kinase KdpD [Flexibacter flexilis DSM 6793]